MAIFIRGKHEDLIKQIKKICHIYTLTRPSGAIGIREDGVMESSSAVDVMEEEEEGEDDDDDDNDDDDHDDEEDEGGSDMDEDGAEMIGDDSYRIYEEDDIYIPFDEGSGQ